MVHRLIPVPERGVDATERHSQRVGEAVLDEHPLDVGDCVLLVVQLEDDFPQEGQVVGQVRGGVEVQLAEGEGTIRAARSTPDPVGVQRDVGEAMQRELRRQPLGQPVMLVRSRFRLRPNLGCRGGGNHNRQENAQTLHRGLPQSAVNLGSGGVAVKQMTVARDRTAKHVVMNRG